MKSYIDNLGKKDDDILSVVLQNLKKGAIVKCVRCAITYGSSKHIVKILKIEAPYVIVEILPDKTTCSSKIRYLREMSIEELLEI